MAAVRLWLHHRTTASTISGFAWKGNVHVWVRREPQHPLTMCLFLLWNPDMADKAVVRSFAATIFSDCNFSRHLRSYVQGKTWLRTHKSSSNPQTAQLGVLELVVNFEIALNSELLSPPWDTGFKVWNHEVFSFQQVIFRYLTHTLDLCASLKIKL